MSERNSTVENDVQAPPMRKPDWFAEALSDVKDDLRTIATKYQTKLEFREGKLRVRR